MNHPNYEDALAVWSYMLVGNEVGSADCLIVLGSRDDRVAAYAAHLTKLYTFMQIIITGGVAHGHDLLKTSWAEGTEAEHFLAVMRGAGCKGEVLLEKQATNTGENAVFTHNHIVQRGIGQPKSIVIVTKPYMERRALATFEAQWPGAHTEFVVTSPLQDFDEYMSEDQNYDDVVNIMVGDLERIIEYPKLGFQSLQAVPDQVIGAWQRLVAAGYTKHLMNK